MGKLVGIIDPLGQIDPCEMPERLRHEPFVCSREQDRDDDTRSFCGLCITKNWLDLLPLILAST